MEGVDVEREVEVERAIHALSAARRTYLVG